MNKKLRITIDVIIILLGILFLALGIKDSIDYINSNKVSDAERFKHDYSYVSDENRYKYLSLKKMDKMLEKNTGIILIGSPLDPSTQVLVSPLENIVSSNDLDIYYLETKDIDNKSKYYKSVLSKLHLEDFEVPNILFVKDGKIIKSYLKSDIYESDYKDALIEYWTDERIKAFNKEMSKQISNIK